VRQKPNLRNVNSAILKSICSTRLRTFVRGDGKGTELVSGETVSDDLREG
jgi:hypothetical protein